MLIEGDYAIDYLKKKNMICIILPPTPDTVMNTLDLPKSRKLDIPDRDLLLLLLRLAKLICSTKVK